MGGDINEVFYNFEKKGRQLKNQNVLNAFCDTFEDCGLFDLGFSGYEYTWWNRRDGQEAMEERLDRYGETIEWSSKFPNANVSHLDEKVSDQLPIILRLKNEGKNRRKGKKSFKFENMWVTESSM